MEKVGDEFRKIDGYEVKVFVIAKTAGLFLDFRSRFAPTQEPATSFIHYDAKNT